MASNDSRISSSSRVKKKGLHSHSLSSIERSHFRTESYKTCEERSLQSLDDKNEKPNWKNYLPSFSRASPPPYPFTQYHIDVLCDNIEIMEILVKGLEIMAKWTDICNEEKRSYFQVEFLLTWWWNHHIHEGHTEELKKFTDIVAANNRADLRDHIYKVPDHGVLHKSVIAAVCAAAVQKWRNLASALGLKQTHLNTNITPSLGDESCIQIVFRIWQAKEPGCQKLNELVKVCNVLGLDMLASDLEQGLSVDVLKKIAGDIDNGRWECFGHHLSITKIRRDAFREKFHRISERVFNMMCYWSMIQPLNVDKREIFVHALESCQLEHLAEEHLFRDSTRSPEEEIANTKEIAREEERQKKLLREVPDLEGQLVIMKTKYDDAVQRLEEESQKMNSFKLKYAELELELHQTKRALASNQGEVEILKKELEGYKKQTRLGNETGKQIRDKLMAEHDISRAAVDTVFSLREEHELFECIEAVKAVGGNLQRARNYFKECDTCFTKFGMHKLLTLPLCQCHLCTECVSGHFTVLAQTTSCMDRFVCPACNEPDLKHCTAEQYEAHFSLLSGMLKSCLAKKDYELYQQKLVNWGLIADVNFRWCAHGCGAGFIYERVGVQKVQCPECKEYQCFDCIKPWLDQHDNISCEEFDAWKRSNDPEFQQQGLAAHLKENGINCPKCKMRYELAKGGCMHFKCPQCHHEFCCGCNLPFRSHPACNLLRSCIGKGLHAHHPRDCFYYLRDEECHDLQQLLQKHGINYSQPKNAADAGNGEGPQVCPVKEQQETPDGLVDAICGKPLKDQCGLCENHYKEYLVGLINQNNIDPVDIFGVDSLQAALRRNDKRIPNRVPNEADAAYCARLRQEVQLQLLLRPVIAQAVQSVAAAPFWQR